LIGYLAFLLARKSGWPGRIILLLVFLALVVSSYFWGAGIYEYVGLYVHYKQLNKIELKQLPVTHHERIQPLNSIRTLVKQEALAETEEATEPSFVRRSDGSYGFNMCIGPSPEYTAQRLTKNMYQVISVSGTTPSPSFAAKNRHDVNFEVGEFLLLSQNTDNAVIKRFNFLQYFSFEPAEVTYLQNDNGEWVQVVSLVKWKGFLIPRPVFGGVMVIRQSEHSFINSLKRIFIGDGQMIPAVKVREHNYLRGQDLLPVRAARFVAESFRFQAGLLAPLPGYHEGDIRIPDLPEDQNQQPFVAFFDFSSVDPGVESSLYNYFGLEPYQESKKGLNTSIFLPGDGRNEVYFIDHAKNRDALIGSSAVPSRIVESRKEYDWNKSHPAESRPYIRELNGHTRFFWLSTVVTMIDTASKDFIGGSIPDVTITDGHFGQVVWINRNNLGDPLLWNQQIEQELKIFWDKN